MKGWMCPSTKPGMSMRPRRSMIFVSRAASAAISASDPTATMRVAGDSHRLAPHGLESSSV